jgi:hypothetical protein
MTVLIAILFWPVLIGLLWTFWSTLACGTFCLALKVKWRAEYMYSGPFGLNRILDDYWATKNQL